MPATRRIFLSMVSDEFLSCRKLLTEDLERAGVVVATQEKWGVVNGSTLDKLDTHLQTCDAVVHLVGNALGHVPPPASVDALLARHPGLLAHFNPDIGLTRARLAACSYTQWEAYLTLFHGRGLYLYRPAALPIPLLIPVPPPWPLPVIRRCRWPRPGAITRSSTPCKPSTGSACAHWAATAVCFSPPSGSAAMCWGT